MLHHLRGLSKQDEVFSLEGTELIRRITVGPRVAPSSLPDDKFGDKSYVNNSLFGSGPKVQRTRHCWHTVPDIVYSTHPCQKVLPLRFFLRISFQSITLGSFTLLCTNFIKRALFMLTFFLQQKAKRYVTMRKGLENYGTDHEGGDETETKMRRGRDGDGTGDRTGDETETVYMHALNPAKN